jgi:hypothetical protein
VLRRVVVDDLRLEIREDTADRFIAYVHVNQRDAVWHIGTPPAAMLPERIDHENLVAGREIRVDDVRSDKAGPAGNDDPDCAALLASD